jgi:hypothetical protein
MPSILCLRRPASANNHCAENTGHRDGMLPRLAIAQQSEQLPTNRDSLANGARWAGPRAAATAYRVPTRRRPLSPRGVGVQPAGARAAVIGSADGPQLRASWHHGRSADAQMPALLTRRMTASCKSRKKLRASRGRICRRFQWATGKHLPAKYAQRWDRMQERQRQRIEERSQR